METEDICILPTTIDELPLILLDPKLSQTSKIGSLYYSLYPFVGHEFRKRYQIVDGYTYDPNIETKFNDELGRDDQCVSFIALVCIFGLDGSFSRQENLPKQITSRAKALCASAEMNPPEQSLVRALITESQFSTSQNNSVIDEMAGITCAFDKNFKYNLEVTVETIADIQELKQKYNLNFAAASLLTQIRTVFERKNTKSLRFGIGVIEDLVESKLILGDALDEEIKGLMAIKPAIMASPYINLCKSVKTQYQVSKYARIILIGVLFYGENLERAEDKNKFKEYKIESIERHIADHKDRKTCRDIVSKLPKLELRTLAQLLSFTDPDTAESIIKSKTESEQRVITHILHSNFPDSPWSKYTIAGKITANFINRAKPITEEPIGGKKKIQEETKLLDFETIFSTESDAYLELVNSLKAISEKYEAHLNKIFKPNESGSSTAPMDTTS